MKETGILIVVLAGINCLLITMEIIIWRCWIVVDEENGEHVGENEDLVKKTDKNNTNKLEFIALNPKTKIKIESLDNGSKKKVLENKSLTSSVNSSNDIADSVSLFILLFIKAQYWRNRSSHKSGS